MKNLYKPKSSMFLIVGFFFFVSCNFEVIEHEVRTLSQVEGNIELLPDNSRLEIICFSGYNEKHKNVWTQIVASDLSTGRKLRIITPLSYRNPIKQQMTFRTIKPIEKEVLNYLDSIDTEKLDKDVREILGQFNLLEIKEALSYENTDSIKVFFNPKFKEILEQKLPIIIGRLE